MSSPAEKQKRPGFDRATALGWSDVALDGLSCYLRCVEAVLRWRGCSREEVATALAGPVDLLRQGRSGSVYDAYAVEWRIAVDGRANRQQLEETIRGGEPAILMPDRFFWPGDELQDRRHFHDHMVLAFEIDGDVLLVLDTDAPREQDYVRAVPWTEQVWLACTRWGVVREAAGGAPPGAAPFAERALEPSLRLLSTDTVELRAFAERCRLEGLDELTARALHVAALGDFQPTLFLFAEGIRNLKGDEELATLVAPALTAAKAAKSLGLLLLALHRDPNPPAYGIAIGALDCFLAAAETLLEAIATELDSSLPAPGEPTDLVRRRLRELAAYCFSAESPSTVPRPAASSVERVSRCSSEASANVASSSAGVSNRRASVEAARRPKPTG
jgi:hypothetical protein